MARSLRSISAIILVFVASTRAQQVTLREAPPLTLPGRVDSNSPSFYVNGQFTQLTSTGGAAPMLSRGPDQFQLTSSEAVRLVIPSGMSTWIEAVWVDPTGVIIGWYHQEKDWVCGTWRPSQPQIGVAFSYDGGNTFQDQGLILTSGDPPDCSSKNGFFTGGHGDFSVVLDRSGSHFYFLFGNYAGPLESQGVTVARLAYDDRFHQSGNVWKHSGEGWAEPGLGGRTRPVFPAVVSWQQAETDSFWGPAVHWNTHLNMWVALMNRSCCTTGFPQEGIYISFNPDIANPSGWSVPQKLLADSGWYPQVIGMGPGETDTIAGKKARLYIYGHSSWEIEFGEPEAVAPPAPTEPVTEPEPVEPEPVEPTVPAPTEPEPVAPEPEYPDQEQLQPGAAR